MQKGQFLVGAWLGEWPSDGNNAVAGFEGRTGVRLDLVDVYLDWFTPVANVTHTLHHIAAHGAVAILTWEAQTVTTQDILAGTREMPLRDGRRVAIDAYVSEFAGGVCAAARQQRQPVLLRLLHEMNGGWFAWGVSYTDAKGNHPNSVDSYKKAWVKLHDAFTSRCGNDVRFIWAVNHYSVGAGTGFTNTYPGDGYVDYLGIDGYNWGANAGWGWHSFDDIFRPGYCALATIPAKPILVTEVATSERGGDKPAWISDMYAKLAAYGRVRGFVWLNDAKYEVETHGALDWNVDSTPASLAAYRAGAQAILQARDAGSAVPAAAVPICP